MNHEEGLFVVSVALVVALVFCAWDRVFAYSHLDDPCASGGIEVCDMEWLVEPELWRYRCSGLAMPEVLWCNERAAVRP